MRHAALLWACLCFLSGAAAADGLYAASAWPYRVKRSGDALEYAYDLTAIKAGAISADGRAEAGEERVSKFLASLPREVRASVRLGPAALALAAPGEPERAPLAASFSRVAASELVRGPSIGKKASARMVPELHPDWPKLLPSLDLVLWKGRAVEEGALAAIELAAESGALGLPMGRRELWQRVLERAALRQRESQGDAKEGATLLAARVAAAGCLDTVNLLPEVKAVPAMREAVEAEVAAFRDDAALVPRGPYGWTGELRCIWIRDRVLGAPLPNTRAGAAAALTLLAMLEADPKLARGFAALQELRDSLHGKPGEDVLAQYRTVAGEGGAREAIQDLGGFFGKLEVALGVSEMAPRPTLFALPSRPVTRYLDQLRPAERANAGDELTIAIQEGRLPLEAPAGSAWALFRDAALSPLLRPESDGGLSGRLAVDAPYRSRLAVAFHALQGAHHEGEDEREFDEPAKDEEGVQLRVLLHVPPHLEVEPLPAAYARVAASLWRLDALLETSPRAAALSRVLPDGGRRGEKLRPEVRRLALVMRGLELLSRQVAGAEPGATERTREDGKALDAARAYLGAWRADADSGLDVRALEAPLAGPGDQLMGVFGIGRRELRASFTREPEVKILAGAAAEGLFVADSRGSQSYIIPFLGTGASVVSAARPPDRARFQKLCDQAGRTRESIESALVDAMAR